MKTIDMERYAQNWLVIVLAVFSLINVTVATSRPNCYDYFASVNAYENLDTVDKDAAYEKTFQYRDNFLSYYREAVEVSKEHAIQKLHLKYSEDIKGLDPHAHPKIYHKLTSKIEEINKFAKTADDHIDSEKIKITTKFNGFYPNKKSPELLPLLEIFCYKMQNSVRFHAGEAHQQMLAVLKAFEIPVTDLIIFKPFTVPHNIKVDIEAAFQEHEEKASTEELFRECTKKAATDLQKKYHEYAHHLSGYAIHYKAEVLHISDLVYQQMIRLIWNKISVSIFSPIIGAKIAVEAIAHFEDIKQHEKLPEIVFQHYDKAIRDMNEKGVLALNNIISFSYDILLWRMRRETAKEAKRIHAKEDGEALRLKKQGKEEEEAAKRESDEEARLAQEIEGERTAEKLRVRQQEEELQLHLAKKVAERQNEEAQKLELDDKKAAKKREEREIVENGELEEEEEDRDETFFDADE